MAPIDYGIWGRPTATLDWCEENYVVTPYIAEFWNTLSNWIMVVPPSLAALIAWRQQLEFRITASYLSIALVGIGSLLFHCTLLYNMQLTDELPMLYGTFILLYGMIEIKSKENVMNTPLIALFVTSSVLLSVMYVIVLNPVFFQAAYGSLAICLFGLSFHRYKKYHGSFVLVTIAMSSYAFGFILWNIDNNFCPQLRLVRSSLPVLATPVTQLHAWWHTFAGAGTYFSILFSSHLRLMSLGYQPKLQIYFHFLPFIEREKKKSDYKFNLNNNISYATTSATSTTSSSRKPLKR